MKYRIYFAISLSSIGSKYLSGMRREYICSHTLPSSGHFKPTFLELASDAVLWFNFVVPLMILLPRCVSLALLARLALQQERQTFYFRGERGRGAEWIEGRDSGPQTCLINAT